MRITKVENCPSDMRYFDDHDDDLENKLEPKDVEDIVEIFQTPLTGHIIGTIHMQIIV